MATFKRRQVIVNPAFQFRFAFSVCAWTAALSFVYPILIYSLLTAFHTFVAKTPATELAETVLATRTDMTRLMIAFEAVLLGLAFGISLFMSQRIAGPLYKLERFFAQLGEQGKVPALSFRKHDYFPALAQDFNAAARALEERTRVSVTRASAAREVLQAALGGADAKTRAQIEQALGELRDAESRLAPKPTS